MAPPETRLTGIHGDDGHGLAALAQGARQGVHQRAFARAGRPGDADDARGPGERPQILQRLECQGDAVLDAGGRACEGARVAFADLQAHSFISFSGAAAR